MEHAVPSKNFQRENGTTFSEVPLFPEIFHWNKPKNHVPFTTQPEFPESLGKWKTPKETVPKWRDARIARAHRNSLNFKLRVLIIARTDLRKKRFIERVLKEFSREPYLCFLESFVPFRVYRFTEFEVFSSSTVPFTAHEQNE